MRTPEIDTQARTLKINKNQNAKLRHTLKIDSRITRLKLDTHMRTVKKDTGEIAKIDTHRRKRFN